MNKKTTRLRCLLTAILLVVAMAMPIPASAAITPVEPTTGDGTSENPYQITTAAELSWFADKVNNYNANYSSKNAVLIADIDLEGSATNTWTPIGNTTKQFKGTFDGGGHKITGLYISKSGNNNGLFGYLGLGGVIKNLGVDGTVNSTGNNIGGVCGYNEGTITGCYNNGAVTGKGATGGVCGYNEGKMENCYNKGAVNGYDEVGGVCGHSELTITGCYNTGNVIGTYRFTGGVCGRTGAQTTITCCYNTGAVTGTNNYIASTVIEGENYSARGVGGICGYSCGGTISNSYNTGSVTGKKIVGGVCGYNTNYTGTGMIVSQRSKGTLKYCYNTGTISDEEPAGVTEQINAGGVCGKNDNSNNNAITNCYYLSVSDIIITKLNDLGTAISAEEFADSSKFSEWDFETIWEMFLGRPTLRSVPEIEGKGTETEPYLIPDLATLEQLCNGVNAGRDYSGVYFTLTADIDMSGKYGQFLFNSWTPIGSAVNQFKGTFDGGGHKITGLYTKGSTGFRGLFGYLGRGGVIKNLGVEGTVTDTNSDYGYVGGVCGYCAGTIIGCYNKATVKGYTSVGGVCGHNSGTITSCYNNGDVSSTGSNMGGVCGMSTNTITGCYNTGTVSGIDRVGGVCGLNDKNTLTDCYNTGTISGTSEVGGVCGLNNRTLTNCYNTGTVSGTSKVGGVCGLNKSTLTDCYNTGTVSGTESNIGGVCGSNDSGTITSCYYLIGCNGEGTTFNDLGKAISAEEFVVETTFVDWIFTNIWEMSGWLGRPILSSIPETPIRGGTEKDPFTIPDLETLELIRDKVNAGRGFIGVYFTLTADIDMSGTYNSASGKSWTPIGNESNQFKGVFDGAGHKVSGLYINSKEGNQGLFGYLGSGGVIKNLGVEGTVKCIYMSVGGVCGKNEGTITGCYNIGAITGNEQVGGVCGWNNGTISFCYNTGAVTCNSKQGGGVCGYNYGTISSCYNTGTISGTSEVGGVCGLNNGGTITSCYYLDGCNGEGTTFNDLGTAISSEDFVKEKTFVDWDFTNIWEMSWLGRPILSSNPETNLRGTCDETNPFTVPDLEMLELIYDEVNAGRDFSGVYFTMTADIDMSGKYNSGSGESWKPIGKESNQFKGTFDGGGHKITGLYINGTGSYQGLFGCLGSGGVIRNLGVDGAVTGRSSVGGVCGVNAGGLIFNCYNIGAVTGSIDVGGVCGWNEGSIICCYNTGTVTGIESNIGGVCGINNGINIISCYNVGAVTGFRDVGGVCGFNYKNITCCYYDKDKCKVGGIGGSDKAGCAEGRSTAEFERGEVCYLLDKALPGIWGQHLGTDQYPIINSAYKILAMSKRIEDETYWETFSNWSSDVTFSVPVERTLKVFNVTVSGGALRLSRRSDDQVAKGEGVLLKTDDEYVNYKANETTALIPADYSVNNLVATPDSYRITITADDGYTLYGLMYNDEDTYYDLGFYLGIAKSKTGVIVSTDGSKITVTRGKAYLNAQTKEAKLSGVKVYRFVLISEGVITGVEPVTVVEENSGDDLYDLFGRKVINPVPGIYIKNGEKVFVK
ncbi:MAG: hypothetical protein ACI30C_01725 [Muribaculaceae bacterium]